MYDYATNTTESPTDSASSGSSDFSSVSAWWSSGDGDLSGGTSDSITSNGYAGFMEGPSSSRVYGQMQMPFPMMSQSSQERPPHNPSKYVAISTQYVLAAPQHIPMLARVSVVDYRGNTLYDTFVRPITQVEDLRSSITGLLPEHLLSTDAMAASVVREQVSALLYGKAVIGHSLWIHFSLLGINHPAVDTRDVALYLPFHRSVSSPTITPLKSLVSHLMRRKIGRTYEHPLEEARAAMDLFRSYEDPWENEIRAGAWPCALPPSSFSHFFS